MRRHRLIERFLTDVLGRALGRGARGGRAARARDVAGARGAHARRDRRRQDLPARPPDRRRRASGRRAARRRRGRRERCACCASRTRPRICCATSRPPASSRAWRARSPSATTSTSCVASPTARACALTPSVAETVSVIADPSPPRAHRAARAARARAALRALRRRRARSFSGRRPRLPLGAVKRQKQAASSAASGWRSCSPARCCSGRAPARAPPRGRSGRSPATSGGPGRLRGRVMDGAAAPSAARAASRARGSAHRRCDASGPFIQIGTNEEHSPAGPETVRAGGVHRVLERHQARLSIRRCCSQCAPAIVSRRASARTRPLAARRSPTPARAAPRGSPRAMKRVRSSRSPSRCRRTSP